MVSGLDLQSHVFRFKSGSTNQLELFLDYFQSILKMTIMKLPL